MRYLLEGGATFEISVKKCGTCQRAILISGSAIIRGITVCKKQLHLELIIKSKFATATIHLDIIELIAAFVNQAKSGLPECWKCVNSLNKYTWIFLRPTVAKLNLRLQIWGPLYHDWYHYKNLLIRSTIYACLNQLHSVKSTKTQNHFQCNKNLVRIFVTDNKKHHYFKVKSIIKQKEEK